MAGIEEVSPQVVISVNMVTWGTGVVKLSSLRKMLMLLIEQGVIKSCSDESKPIWSAFFMTQLKAMITMKEFG